LVRVRAHAARYDGDRGGAETAGAFVAGGTPVQPLRHRLEGNLRPASAQAQAGEVAQRDGRPRSASANRRPGSDVASRCIVEAFSSRAADERTASGLSPVTIPPVVARQRKYPFPA